MPRRVFITGGARGIGAAIAERYHAMGWDVLTPTRQDVDLASPAAVDAYCARAQTTAVDALINNAGENRLGAIDSLAESDLRTMMEINVFSAWKLVRLFAPHMREQRWGRIVNMSSIYGIKSRALRGAYTTTKSALIGFMKTAAIEYGPSNILVNAVAPGFVDTELTRRNNTPEQIAALCEQVPLRRLAETSEIAVLLHWLGSEQNSYVTGQTIAIDGGFLVT